MEQYKDKYQICERSRELCFAECLPEEIRQDFVELTKPKITAKSRASLDSLALAIKTKYKC